MKTNATKTDQPRKAMLEMLRYQGPLMGKDPDAELDAQLEEEEDRDERLQRQKAPTHTGGIRG